METKLEYLCDSGNNLGFINTGIKCSRKVDTA